MPDLKYQCRRCKQKWDSAFAPRVLLPVPCLGEAVHYLFECCGSEAAAFYQGIDIGYGLLKQWVEHLLCRGRQAPAWFGGYGCVACR
jgi:hypothetical protein